MKRWKYAIPAIILAGTSLAPLAPAYAQVVPENQPPVEPAWSARFMAPHRERTILRPWTSTGMNRDTPNGRVNWYLPAP